MAVLCPTHTSSQADYATRCHLGLGCLASSFPAPQSLELSLPVQTADPWKIRDTLLFGDHFPMEPRVATVLPTTSGEPGPTSAHFTLPRTDGNRDGHLFASRCESHWKDSDRQRHGVRERLFTGNMHRLIIRECPRTGEMSVG